ncbi:MAG: hypothetical protein PVSMB5_29150 [Ktedonobacteraceae bacterium]
MAFTPVEEQSGLARNLLVLLFLCLLLLGYGLIRYREMLTFSRPGLLFVGLLLVLTLLFAGYAFIGREVSEGFGRNEMWAQRQGVLFGLLAGLLWVLEIVVDDILPASNSVIAIICLVALLVLACCAGFYGAQHTRSFSFGLKIGLWSGMLGSLIAWIALLLLTYILLERLRLYPQYMLGFRHSGDPDIATYLVKNAIFLAAGHLVLGPLLGLALGALGALAGQGLARRKPAPQADEQR